MQRREVLGNRWTHALRSEIQVAHEQKEEEEQGKHKIKKQVKSRSS